MDAAKLNAMTLEQLRHEAAERGIKGAARMARDTLIERLLEPARPKRAAAGEARPATAKSGARTRATDARPASKGPATSPATSPVRTAARGAPAGTRTGLRASATPGAGSAERSGGKTTSGRGSRTSEPKAPAGSRSPRGTARRGPGEGAGEGGEWLSVPSDTLPDRPPENAPEVMARLYEEQGELERAALIYRELLAVRPDDEELIERLQSVEDQLAGGAPEEHPPGPSGRAGRRPSVVARSAVRDAEEAAEEEGAEEEGAEEEGAEEEGAEAEGAEDEGAEEEATEEERAEEAAVGAVAPEVAAPEPPREPMGMLDFEELPEAYGVDECGLLARDPQHVFAYWEVTEGALDGARQQLGEEGGQASLVLRLFSDDGSRERVSQDYALEWHRGQRYLPVPRPGVRLRAAVGLVVPSGLFAPVAHSAPVRVPPSTPAAQTSTHWIEVPPPRSAGRSFEPISIVPRAARERALPSSTTGLVEPPGTEPIAARPGEWPHPASGAGEAPGPAPRGRWPRPPSGNREG